jgi:hypothetical protein
MSSSEEREYIREKLIPELLDRMDAWGAEYQQPRLLGVRGEFVGIHRKVSKLKTVFWDRMDASDWREDPRTILQEVIAHGLLMLHDLDHQGNGSPALEEDDNPLEVTEEMREAYRRQRHLSGPLKPDHVHTLEDGLRIDHLAHPGVTCEVWEEMRQNGNAGR